MKTNKNIDRLFQEKLKDFEVSPPDNIWKNIDQNLKTNKPKLVFPLWMRYSGVAILLLLLAVGNVNYFDNNPPNLNDLNTIVTDSDNEITPKIDTEFLKKDPLNLSEENSITIAKSNENDKENKSVSAKVVSSNDEQIENKKVIDSNKNQNNNIKNTVVTIQSKKSENDLNTSDTEIANNDNSFKQSAFLKTNQTEKFNIEDSNRVEASISLNKNKAANNLVNSKNDDSNDLSNNYSTSFHENKVTQNDIEKKEILNNQQNKTFDTKIDFEKIKSEKESDIAESEKENYFNNTLTTEDLEKEMEEDTKKWSVASVIAPVFYNSFNAKSSPLDLQFKNSPKKGSKTMSYGAKVSYKINKKLSVQSGVTLVDVGYKIGDVFINPSQQGLQKLSNVNYSSAANILNVQAGNFLNDIQLETSSAVPIKGTLNQEFGYIEVPLELKYKLNNSQKLGVNLVGGFSTLFLNKNEVFVETTEFSSNLGEANNLNNVNFSGNLGFDIDYKINKNLYFNVAPMIKIHTSTFSKNADNFKPYTLGVYSGLNYKF